MLIIKYEGLDADHHRLDAQTGSESLAGFGHALTLIAHYAATGSVRFRAPYSDQVKFFFTANREGSLEWLLETAVSHPADIAFGLGVEGISALAMHVLARAIGAEPPDSLDKVHGLKSAREGDIEALVEAVEPALKRAHRTIGISASTISLIETQSRSLSVLFDQESKHYLEDDVDGGMLTQDVSVGALNVNSRYGRAYFSDLGRTVPFRVDREAHPRTMTELSRALDDYAKKNGVTVSITFRRIMSSDNRLKRVVIHNAKHLEGDEL